MYKRRNIDFYKYPHVTRDKRDSFHKLKTLAL